MDFDLYLRFALALILVLGLIALLAWPLFGEAIDTRGALGLGLIVAGTLVLIR